MLLRTKLNHKQTLAAQAWNNPDIIDVAYGGAKYGGKSFLGCNLIFADALTYPETFYFIARKKLNDLRKYTIPSIFEAFKLWEIDPNRYLKYNGQDNYFELYNKSRVYLIEAKYLPQDPLFQRFGSMQMTRGWIEEAGELDPEAIENLSATTGRWKNHEYNLSKKILYTTNPTKGYMYSAFFKPARDGLLLKHQAFIKALPQDNIYGDANYIASLFKILKGANYERLLMGNWEYDDDPYVLMAYESILDIFTNTGRTDGKKYVSCDVARFGIDKTVIMVWQDLKVIKMYILAKSSIPRIIEILQEISEKYIIPRSHFVVDEGGVGGGVVDGFKGCKGFLSNASPIQPREVTKKINPTTKKNYGNLRDQCYSKLAELVNDGLVGLYCPNEQVKQWIIEELETIKEVDVENDSHIKIIPKEHKTKESIKQKIGRSPDFADAMMMRMFFELQPAKKALIDFV